MDEEASIILGDAIAFCQRDGQDARLINMLSQSRGIELTEDTLTIEAPSRFAIAQLMKHKATIEAYLEEIAFAPVALNVVAPQTAGSLAATPAAPVVAQAAPTVPAAAAPVAIPPAAAPASTAAAVAPGMPQLTPVPAAQPAAPQTVAAEADVSRETTELPWNMPNAATPAASAAPQEPAAAPAGHVQLRNTMSMEDFRRMQQSMKEGAAAKPAAATPAAKPAQAEPEPEFDDAPLAANSKFTFENFVYGEENKHAYRSALKFAVTADEPGNNTSLFIYGNSGLGKTHLLLAIKNEIAEKFPQIKVKYANSQAYIDDFINGVARQKQDGARIMRSYHDADVLIIDDIQNIIGKTASIDYFFSLMDEFIRKSKKIVIASDRAPKNLGMDERLTSRFNAGMLCLVSEPGFEMKYMILKRYYENNIATDADPADNSLLAGLGIDRGKLTDDQLRHMAEVSGNNIRELESFCERCAGAAGDAEQEGGELTDNDIDTIAGEYFDTAPKKINIQTVQAVIEEQYGVAHEDLIGPKRNANIAKARHVAIYLAIEMCDMTTTTVGAEFGGRNHSTVSTSYKKVQKMIAEDRGFTEDLKALRNRITLRS